MPHDDQDFQELLMVFSLSFSVLVSCVGAEGGAALCPQLETVYMLLNVQKPLCSESTEHLVCGEGDKGEATHL